MLRFAGWFALVVSTLSVLPAAALAQEGSMFRARGAVLAGYVASKDQQASFGLDLPVLELDVRAGAAVHELVTLEGRLGGGAFLSSVRDPGVLLDLTVGVEVGGDFDVGRAWASLHFGAGVTGALVRPVLRVGVGLDLYATPEVAIGPVLQYGHVFHDDGTTPDVWHSDDAMFVSFGLSVRIAPGTGEPEPEPELEAEPEDEPEPQPAPLLLVRSTVPPIEEAALMELIDEAVRPEPRELVVPVLFGFDSTELVSCSVASLHSLRDYLNEHEEIQLLEIEGHADGSGTDRYNRALSERRAEAIRDWLIERGVSADRLRTAARGESTPVEPNDEDGGRAQNRRARFRVVRERAQ